MKCTPTKKLHRRKGMPTKVVQAHPRTAGCVSVAGLLIGRGTAHRQAHLNQGRGQHRLKECAEHQRLRPVQRHRVPLPSGAVSPAIIPARPQWSFRIFGAGVVGSQVLT